MPAEWTATITLDDRAIVALSTLESLQGHEIADVARLKAKAADEVLRCAKRQLEEYRRRQLRTCGVVTAVPVEDDLVDELVDAIDDNARARARDAQLATAGTQLEVAHTRTQLRDVLTRIRRST